jgi:hypothetical protein
MDKLPIAGRSAHAMDQIIPARRRQQPYLPFVYSRRFLRTSPVESCVQGVHYDIEPPDSGLALGHPPNPTPLLQTADQTKGAPLRERLRASVANLKRTSVIVSDLGAFSRIQFLIGRNWTGLKAKTPCKSLKNLVGSEGLEPPTSCL